MNPQDMVFPTGGAFPIFGANLGLTKREWLIGQALQGLASREEQKVARINMDVEVYGPGELWGDVLAEAAIHLADDVIRKLEAETENPG